jgi:hypothetical protein
MVFSLRFLQQCLIAQRERRIGGISQQCYLSEYFHQALYADGTRGSVRTERLARVA